MKNLRMKRIKISENGKSETNYNLVGKLQQIPLNVEKISTDFVKILLIF